MEQISNAWGVILMMASVSNSSSPQYFVYQPLPDGLSNRQRDRYLQGIFIAELRSAFMLIAELQKQLTRLQLNKDTAIVSPLPSTPSTIPLTPSPAPGAPVSSCTPAAATAEDVLSPHSASASSRLYPPVVDMSRDRAARCCWVQQGLPLHQRQSCVNQVW